jgi:hypothetical protein
MKHIGIGGMETGKKRWQENELFYKGHRSIILFMIGFLTFVLVISILVFLSTRDIIAFLIIPAGIMPMAIAYAVFLLVPQHVRLFEDGLQLQYRVLWSDKTVLWEKVKKVSVKKIPPAPSELPERYLLKFFDENNKSLTILPIPFPPALYSAIWQASRQKNPGIGYAEISGSFTHQDKLERRAE